jgi:hypothetical protein
LSLIAGAVVAFTLTSGVLANLIYNTNYVRGIGYDLSAQERSYVDRVSNIQAELESAVSEQQYVLDDYLATAYPSVSDEHGWRAAEQYNRSRVNLEAAEGLSAPNGCEEHYSIWLEGAKSADFFVGEAAVTMFSGNEQLADEHLSYARIGLNDLEREFDKANRLLRRIERVGCDL